MIHQVKLDIHDFEGHQQLGAGQYAMPFSIPVPLNADPSFELSPCEGSLLELRYYLEVTLLEKQAP